ncbi:uncharacterized protein LOC133183935 [Saccostrea echinata]|uniref:uncharacterized protein LOC133183935 n=1 Tax=Saccostrea echinata TaxID=191078 RepID=UPI002A83E279|nr:uncharacterized protein LOC133183935 [Saccostrea echinata]
MATVNQEEETFELAMCSICMGQYKLPKCLPCSHTFCQNCLSTHIKSSCSSCDSPLGFSCPLCRVFIPAPGRIGQYSCNDWAVRFPENKFIAAIAGNYSSLKAIPCSPCNEDGEEAKANSWCKDCSEALCNECVTCHKKSRPSRHHEVILLTDMSKTMSVMHEYPALDLENCGNHNGRRLELFCETHLVPCCSICVTKEHAGCWSFCQIEELSDKLTNLESAKVKNLQYDVEELCSSFERIIKEEKSNIDEIDDISDKFTKEISQMSSTLIEAVKCLEETHLTELAKASKESKSKLRKSLDSFEQRLLLLQYWKELLQKNLLPDESSKTKLALSYCRMKQIHEHLTKLDNEKLNIHIETKLPDNVRNLLDSCQLAEISVREYKTFVRQDLYNVKNVMVKKISEFEIPGAKFHGGIFHNDDQLLLADMKKCVLCNTNGVVLREISLPGSPWDVCSNGEKEVLVSLPQEKRIVKLMSDSFEVKETVDLGCHCYGISMHGATIAVGARDSVEVFQNFAKVTSFNDFRSTDDVEIDTENNVIYASYSHDTVIKQDMEGNILFTYENKELKRPYGLTVDGIGNIYVNGSSSNNIHILSRSGENIRILEGVEKPRCIKFQEGTNRFFVGESGGKVKIFELTA